jgi:hypothetical protein
MLFPFPPKPHLNKKNKIQNIYILSKFEPILNFFTYLVLLIPIHWTNEFTTSPLGPIHYDQRIHPKYSEITWHIGTPFVGVVEFNN